MDVGEGHACQRGSGGKPASGFDKVATCSKRIRQFVHKHIFPTKPACCQFKKSAPEFKCVVFTIIFAGGATFVILKVVSALVGLRVSEEDESVGLDLTQHGESAYND